MKHIYTDLIFIWKFSTPHEEHVFYKMKYSFNKNKEVLDNGKQYYK